MKIRRRFKDEAHAPEDDTNDVRDGEELHRLGEGGRGVDEDDGKAHSKYPDSLTEHKNTYERVMF